MTKEKYLQIQMMVIQVGQIAHQLDLDGFLQQIATTSSAGTVLDPALHAKAAANLEVIKQLAESLVPVKKVFETTFKTIIENASKEVAQKIISGEQAVPQSKL